MEIFKFAQSCDPNCSYVHFKHLMCVSASRNIPKGATLTLDLASDTDVLKRKNVLQNKYGINCFCEICEWKKWPSDLSKNKEVYDVVYSLTNLRMMKQIFWGLIRKKKVFQAKFGKEYLFKDVIEKYVEAIKLEIHWEDLLNLLRLLRDENSLENTILLRETLCIGLSAFLKVPLATADQIIDQVL